MLIKILDKNNQYKKDIINSNNPPFLLKIMLKKKMAITAFNDLYSCQK